MVSKIGIRFYSFDIAAYQGWTYEFYFNNCGITSLTLDVTSFKFCNTCPHKRMDKYRK